MRQVSGCTIAGCAIAAAIVAIFVLSCFASVSSQVSTDGQKAHILPAGRLPNLKAVDIWTSQNPPIGGSPTTVYLKIATVNQYTASPKFYTDLYIDGSPNYTYRGELASLAGNSEYTFSVVLTLTTGSHTLLLFVDSTNAVVELAEKPAVAYNNELVETITWTPPSLVGYWDMSTLRNGKLQNLADPTGATDGTMFNTTPSGDGIVGGSLPFNGNNAAVNCPDPNNLLKSDSGTVSAWIKSTGKPPETKKLRAALVFLENGENATQLDENKRLLRFIGENATRIYSEMVHGNGSLEVSDTIYIQTPIDVNIPNHQLVELNNFISLNSQSDIYDYICFFTEETWAQGEMTFKDTIHGIGEPYMWYDDLDKNTIPNSDYSEPHSGYITAAAVIMGPIHNLNEISIQDDAWTVVHELSHAYCAWWHYKVGETTYYRPGGTYHYSAGLRTDLHSVQGGYGWKNNSNGTWTATASLKPSYNMTGYFDDTDFNLDEYSIGLIPASEVRNTHRLVPDQPYYLPDGMKTRTVNDSEITIGQIIAADGIWWNEEDRQCVMLRCTDPTPPTRDVFKGQGWGLFVGTVAPNDKICWWSGSADGTIDWQYGNTSVCDGTWHSIAVSWSGTTGRLYVDGVLDIERTIHPVTSPANAHTVIGCERSTNPYMESWFNGSIDEVYIFNRNLTDAEIKQLYGYSDNFDDDGMLSPWTRVLTSPNVVEVVNSNWHSPPYSLHVSYLGRDACRAASPAIPLDYTRPYTITLYCNIVSGNLLDIVDDGRLEIMHSFGTLLAMKAGGGSVPITSTIYNQWLRFDIKADPANSSYEVLINGVSYGLFAFKNPSSTNTQVYVGSPTAPGRRGSGNAYWDDIWVSGKPP